LGKTITRITTSANETSGYPPFQASFSSSPEGGIPQYSFSWNFGDEYSVSTEQNPTHTFDHTGVYTVTLTVTDAGNQVVTKSM